MHPTTTALLAFGEAENQLDPKRPGRKELRHGLSMVVEIGPTLWLANDETVTLERLTRQPGPALVWADHQRFDLHALLRLPAPPTQKPSGKPAKVAEADIEGMAHDTAGNYLWLVGSHALKRKKAAADKSAAENQTNLAGISADGNRYLLARIPLAPDDAGLPALHRRAADGRQAAQLAGDDAGNDLTRALALDKHLAPFLAIPGKDNGFDIEGLAVRPNGHVLLGLRGPVLRGWAVVLEIALDPDPTDSALLRLRPIGPDKRLYCKHFVQLRGLGIRDLRADGADLLILAGPTMDVDAPVTVFRWHGGPSADHDEVVFATEHQLTTVLEVPVSRTARLGTDRAEGFCLLAEPAEHLLVVYDAADPVRFTGAAAVTADVFLLPGVGA